VINDKEVRLIHSQSVAVDQHWSSIIVLSHSRGP